MVINVLHNYDGAGVKGKIKADRHLGTEGK